MRQPDHPATPTVLEAFHWSSTFGSWDDRTTQRNARPIIQAALARARSRADAQSSE